jgi:prepilin-type N-terminal cleavage/methylation domain-containing protein
MKCRYHLRNQRNRLVAPSELGGGFTLIELLIVMGVIGTMAGMVMYALMGAQNDSRVARTRGTVQKISDIVLQKWEEYRYRAVDLRADSFRLASQPIVLPAGVNPPPILPRAQSHLRTMILRDTMRMEMPDRASDLLYGPSHYVIPQHNASQAGSFLAQRAYPLRFGAVHRALKSALSSSPSSTHNTLAAAMVDPPVSGVVISAPATAPPALFGSSATPADFENAVESGELLYLIVATSTFGGSPALELFRASEIGDSDGDGLLEFIDAWGQRIDWIRWPAGYPSDLNRQLGTDAMDPLRTDWRYSDTNYTDATRPQTIVPLIVSRGQDEQYGCTFGFANGSGVNVPLNYALMRQGSGANQYYVDPFFTWDANGLTPNGSSSAPPILPSRNNQLGSVVPAFANFAADDITNHDLILEP